VEPFHLFRYIDEQAFRYNHRTGMNDGDRFAVAVDQLIGKRLTYAALTDEENKNKWTKRFKTSPEPEGRGKRKKV
jgi:hypothetical protein